MVLEKYEEQKKKNKNENKYNFLPIKLQLANIKMNNVFRFLDFMFSNKSTECLLVNKKRWKNIPQEK